MYIHIYIYVYPTYHLFYVYKNIPTYTCNMYSRHVCIHIADAEDFKKLIDQMDIKRDERHRQQLAKPSRPP